jgi:hypothetical protein
MDCFTTPTMSDAGDGSKVHRRMEVAKAKDKSSSMILNRLKESLHVRDDLAPSHRRVLNLIFQPIEPEPTTTVEFLLHKSLPDTNPTIVKRKPRTCRARSRHLTSYTIQEVLRKSPTLEEILWNFSRFKDPKKRLSLSQNPHFYEWLPTSLEEYGGKFRTYPIETFLHTSATRFHVLTDNPGPTGRVFLETAHDKRAFGNVWIPNKAIIFKGSPLSVIFSCFCPYF